MEKVGVKVRRNQSSFSLNGTRMKMHIIIDCTYEYKTTDGDGVTEEIYKAIETIMEKYSERQRNMNTGNDLSDK